MIEAVFRPKAFPVFRINSKILKANGLMKAEISRHGGKKKVERSTGAILIPRIATDIIGVSQTMNTIVGEVSQYRWVPNWADTMIRSIIGASVFFALVAGYLRFRS